MQVLVSVIIPVFNNIKTLKRCVDSVISQTYKDLEIILVDNGSTDSSEALCEKYLKADDRVILLHEKNEGVSSARNQGIKIAGGEYITFIDADDHILPEYIEKLVAAFEGDDCILSACNSYDVDGDNFKERIFSKKGKCPVKPFLYDLFYCKAESGTCWGKLYRTADINNLFRRYNYCEDAFFNFDYLSDKKGYVSIVPDRMYYYVRRDNSITGIKKTSDLTDVIKVCAGIRDICHEKYPEFAEASNIYLLNNAFFVYLNSRNNKGSDGDHLREVTLKVIRKYRGKALLDRRATFKTKAACLISFISLRLLSYLYGKVG
ncbi:MAG: glycosyltransferase family 2 protein [Lachnospiraceae bacterium]|nr:glycosyltransferase family 2 protein [Lachnospiraceae bacterium]